MFENLNDIRDVVFLTKVVLLKVTCCGWLQPTEPPAVGRD